MLEKFPLLTLFLEAGYWTIYRRRLLHGSTI